MSAPLTAVRPGAGAYLPIFAHTVSTRIADDYETSVIAEHGRDSDEYRIRVLGDFPSGDEDSYIAATDVTAAMNRDITYHKAEKKTWSLDPARYGRDGSALGKRIGRVILPLQRKHGLDTMAVAGWVKNEYDETPTDEKPSEIMIDVIGIGAGVFDRLNEQGLPVRAVNVAETPSFGKKWMRLRDELWYRTKHALKFIKLPEDDELLEDLTTPRYEYASDGRLKIESKEAMRKRGKASPDKGDAVCMLMLEEDFAMVSETSGNRGWSTALVRGLNATL